MIRLAFLLLALFTLLPFVPSGGAMILGIAFALFLGNPFAAQTKKYTSSLLQVSVVGLGFGMDLLVVGQVGAQGLNYTAISILSTLGVGLLLGRILRVSRDSSLLISTGTAICGGSAIAAVSAAIKAENEDITVALATVFLLNAAALFLFPPFGHALNLSQEQFGLWSALAIHDTSSVVGTTIQYGAEALKIGTTVKLVRALWITPITLGISFLHQQARKGVRPRGLEIPWFMLGFVLASALVTWIPDLRPFGNVAAATSRRLLVLTLFLVGSNLSLIAIKKVGWKPMLQGLCLWGIAATGSLFAILQGWIHL